MTLEISDLDLIKDNALKKFDERVSGAGDDRKKMEHEIAKLESQLEQMFSFFVVMARRESDMIEIAAMWADFVKTCDKFAGKVFQLAQRHSLDIAPYDNILDIRSSAEELRALHTP